MATAGQQERSQARGLAFYHVDCLHLPCGADLRGPEPALSLLPQTQNPSEEHPSPPRGYRKPTCGQSGLALHGSMCPQQAAPLLEETVPKGACSCNLHADLLGCRRELIHSAQRLLKLRPHRGLLFQPPGSQTTGRAAGQLTEQHLLRPPCDSSSHTPEDTLVPGCVEAPAPRKLFRGLHA